MQTFTIRSYGRTELALLYSPHISPDTAWRKLRRWIARYPGLTEQLCSLGYDGSTRSFTSHQVRAIVDALGEP